VVAIGVHAHDIDGTTLVVADGAIDLSRMSRLRFVLRQAVALDAHEIVVDLGTAKLLDATAVGLLVRYRGQVEEHGGRLRVVDAQGMVLQVLEVVGLAKSLGAYDPRDSAPPRPAQPCCRPGAEAPLPTRDWSVPTYGMPNDAVHELLLETAGLSDEDPYRRELRARAIELALPAAYQLTMRYRHRGEPTDDLLQLAALGLVKAVDGYDPYRGHRFSDYAMPTILGEIRRHFRDNGWGMRVPRSMQELWIQSRDEFDRLTQLLGRAPTAEDVARSLDVPREKVVAAAGAGGNYRPESLSTPIPSGTAELGDLIGAIDPAYERVDNHEVLREALAGLPERTRRILSLRFVAEMSQSEIAAEVGLSQMHVSRLLNQAFAALRTSLLQEEETTPEPTAD
jgi:RNA polymerase sigma-70 factor (sigma-B/F/G subfamily)